MRMQQTITNAHILRELRYLPSNKMQEVLDFVRFLRRPLVKSSMRSVNVSSSNKLLDFAGILKDSPNFNDSPLSVQEKMRCDWD